MGGGYNEKYPNFQVFVLGCYETFVCLATRKRQSSYW